MTNDAIATSPLHDGPREMLWQLRKDDIQLAAQLLSLADGSVLFELASGNTVFTATQHPHRLVALNIASQMLDAYAGQGWNLQPARRVSPAVVTPAIVSRHPYPFKTPRNPSSGWNGGRAPSEPVHATASATLQLELQTVA
jgi:hypothetical protein